MIEIVNESLFAVGLYPGFNQDGKHQLTCVAKSSFSFDTSGNLQLLTTNIAETNKFIDEPGKSSLSATSEIMPFKNNTEIIIYGTAQAPVPSTVTEVSVRIHWLNNSIWEKQLRVFGPRIWQKTAFGTIPSKPKQLQPVLLSYEKAYHGPEQLPQIEQGPNFIKKPSDKPISAGFGPIPWFWQETSNNFAPVDQRFEKAFQGNEKITLKGLLANIETTKDVSILLPRLKPKLKLRLNEQNQNLTPLCDTVVINTDTQEVNMIWRASIPWQINDQRTGLLLVQS